MGPGTAAEQRKGDRVTQKTRQHPRRGSRGQPRPDRTRSVINGDMLAVRASPARAKVPKPPPDLPPLEPDGPPQEEPEPDETPAPPWEPAEEPVPA